MSNDGASPDTTAPAGGSGARRRLAAIMFTDMVGYSALAQGDETSALALLGRHNRLLRSIFPRYRGQEIKTIGDAFLVSFESALDATQCAIELQRTLHELNATSPDDGKIRIRIGIHVGDVVQSEGDVLGDAVNIASRIQPLAEPGGICLTQQVYDQVQNKVSVPFARVPSAVLKNIRLPINVYRVVPAWESRSEAGSRTRSDGGRHLAVLPLANISPDPHDDYFADGLTEELISVLSQVPDLTVVARTSVMVYKTAPKSIAQVGAELGVDTVLEGSVRKSGEHLRITLQLIDAATQGHVWAHSYDRDVGDVFAVQTDIAERTAEALRLELAKGQRSTDSRKLTANPAAYDQYLRGLVAASELHGKGFAEAVRAFEAATKLDPTFAEAFAAWADLYVVVAGDYFSMREVMPKARELAARALELDSECSDAHSALGNIALQFDHDWQKAEAEFERAIALNPSNATAHQFYSILLIAQERFEEAKAMIRRTIVLDPGGVHRGMLAWAEAESGNVQAAIEWAREEVERHPESVRAHVFAGLAYAAAGRKAEAQRETDFSIAGATDEERFDHALLGAVLGKFHAAREIVAEVERGEAKSYTSKAHLAMMYSALGEESRALDLLEQDYREGDQVLWLFYRGVFFDPIRETPRFVALLKAYGVPAHSVHHAPLV